MGARRRSGSYALRLIQPALVADAAGDLELVEVLEEGEGVFAAAAEEVADLGDSDAALLLESSPDASDGLLVGRGREDDVLAHADGAS